MNDNLLCVLLVEDEPVSRMVLERQLRRAGITRTLVASNGYEALNMLPEGEQPDLILTDVHMPDIDGLNLVAFLRQRSAFATTPIIAVTADAADSRDWIAEGFSAYLGKPYTFEDLKRTLRQVGILSASDDATPQ